MATNRKPEWKYLSIRINNALLCSLQAEAEKEMMALSTFVRRILGRWVEARRPTKSKKPVQQTENV